MPYLLWVQLLDLVLFLMIFIDQSVTILGFKSNEISKVFKCHQFTSKLVL